MKPCMLNNQKVYKYLNPLELNHSLAKIVATCGWKYICSRNVTPKHVITKHVNYLWVHFLYHVVSNYVPMEE